MARSLELKKILNSQEAATDARLREICERNAARVFAKVRLADVLPVERAGLTRDDYRFSLMSHFDFLVVSATNEPLFAVEFDGPSHRSEKQRKRDRTKDRLCRDFGLPILRINSNYLHAKYRNMDLLSWFVEVWFASQWFDEAQVAGHIPHDEPFMPMALASIPGRTGQFPLWLSTGIRRRIQEYFFADRIRDMVPSVYIGRADDGTYRAIGFLRVSETTGVMAETAMRAQQFPVSLAQALDEVIIFDLYERLEATLSGHEPPLSIESILARLETIRRSHECRFAVNQGCESRA